MKLHLLVLLVLSTTVRADVIERQMQMAPLSATSYGFVHLGVKRDHLVAATSKLHPPNPNRFVVRNFGQPISKTKPKTTPELSPPADWRVTQEAVETLLEFNAKQKKRHHAIVFQTLVAKGFLPHAMRYAGEKPDREVERKWLTAVKELKQNLKEQRDADYLSIRIDAIDDVLGERKLKTAIGEAYVFPDALVDEGASALDPDAPCLQPLRLLRFLEIQKELKLTIDQLKKSIDIEKLWLKKTQMVQVEGFFRGVDYELDGPLEVEIDEANDEILVEALGVLKEEQQPRFKELLLRSYIHSDRIDLVMRILDFDLGRKLSREVSVELKAVHHLRALQIYLPIILPAMTDVQKSRYLSYRFVPHTLGGTKAKLTANVFREFELDLVPKPTNPRR